LELPISKIIFPEVKMTVMLNNYLLSLALITSCDKSIKSKLVTYAGSYISIIILTNLIMSPRYRLYLNVGKLKAFNRALSGFLHTGVELSLLIHATLLMSYHRTIFVTYY